MGCGTAQYEQIKAAMFATGGGLQADPAGVGPAILAVADAEQPPLRVFFGTQPIQIV